MREIIFQSMLFAVFFVCHSNDVFSKVYKVGSSQVYKSPNALYQANVLGSGDVVEIDAEIYLGNSCLAKWTTDSITIRGIGGRPHMKANGLSIEGKAIWVITGKDNIIENIEFSGVKVPDKNGAGIRQEGIGVTVRNCFFHHNETAFLSNNSEQGHILIEQSEFSHNGIGNGFSHNVYIGHVETLTFRYNYSHHANTGQTLKTRAFNNLILYNRIMDESTGEASRLIDISNGGFAIVMGNLLMQGSNAQNGNLVGFGHEGLENPGPYKFYFINNTCVNKRTSFANFIKVNDAVSVSNISNNLFAGSHNSIVEGAMTTFEGNLIEEDIDKIKFFDESIYDYRLTEDSPAIDKGVIVDANPLDTLSLVPQFSYFHPRQKQQRVLLNGMPDIGAYELDLDAEPFVVISKVEKDINSDYLLFPNPVREYLIVREKFNNAEFKIYTMQGNLKLSGRVKDERINMNSLSNGVYFLSIMDNGQYSPTFKVLKQ